MKMKSQFLEEKEEKKIGRIEHQQQMQKVY